MEDIKVNFFTKLYKSITDTNFYRNFLDEPLKRAITYLLGVTLIFGSISMVRTIYDLNLNMNQTIDFFDKKVPDFKLENGELTVKGRMPLIIDEKNGDITIIDTTGRTNESVLDKYEKGTFVSKDKIVRKESELQKREYYFSAAKEVTVTKNNVRGLVPLLKWIYVITVLFGLLGFFISKLLNALFLSIIVAITFKVSSIGLTFKDVYKLSLYALTLPIIISTILDIIPVYVPYFWILYYGIALYYLWKAIDNIKKDKLAEENIL